MSSYLKIKKKVKKDGVAVSHKIIPQVKNGKAIHHLVQETNYVEVNCKNGDSDGYTSLKVKITLENGMRTCVGEIDNEKLIKFCESIVQVSRAYSGSITRYIEKRNEEKAKEIVNNPNLATAILSHPQVKKLLAEATAESIAEHGSPLTVVIGVTVDDNEEPLMIQMSVNQHPTNELLIAQFSLMLPGGLAPELLFGLPVDYITRGGLQGGNPFLLENGKTNSFALLRSGELDENSADGQLVRYFTELGIKSNNGVMQYIANSINSRLTQIVVEQTALGNVGLAEKVEKIHGILTNGNSKNVKISFVAINVVVNGVKHSVKIDVSDGMKMKDINECLDSFGTDVAYLANGGDPNTLPSAVRNALSSFKRLQLESGNEKESEDDEEDTPVDTIAKEQPAAKTAALITPPAPITHPAPITPPAPVATSLRSPQSGALRLSGSIGFLAIVFVLTL